MNLGFLASHHGSNMQAVMDACQAGQLNATPSVVVSNNGDSEALARAKREGVPYYHLSSHTHPDPEQLDETIRNMLVRHQVELVILAGYMRKLGAKTLARYAGRVLNIHPALLPRFGGQDMYGQHVHAAVLAAGEKETGISIHLVDGEYDHGSILAQCRLPVDATDTVITLAQRVLEREHTFLVETVAKIVAGTIPLPRK